MRQHLPYQANGSNGKPVPYYLTQQLKVCIFPKLIGRGKDRPTP